MFKKLFVSEINTTLGQRVVEKFEATREWEIIGTRRPNPSVDTINGESLEIPGVAEFIPGYAQDSVEFKKRVLDSDVIICPLTDNAEEAFAAIRMLSNTSFEWEKTFVLVSSTLTWADTHAAQKAEAEAERQAERQALLDAGEELPEEDEDAAGEEAEPEELPVFTEDGYQKRVPHRRYDQWKQLEKFTKQVNSETLHTYVIFGGMQYGAGEDVLHHIFRSAWHGQPLPMYTDGSNVVPTIHVNDLANLTYKVGSSYDVLPNRYILGVDKGNNSLGQIIKSINDQIGTGETVVVPEGRHHTVRFIEQFTQDLRFEPATINDLIEEEEWVCPDGLVAGIEKVAGEYQSKRNVTPVRLVLGGPPLVGKTHLAESIARQFRLQHLRIPDMVEDYQQHLQKLKQNLKATRAQRAEQKRQAAKEEEERAAREAAEEEAAARAAAAEEAEDEDQPKDDDGEEGTEKKAVDKEEEDNDDFIEFEVAAPPPRATPTGEDGEEGEEGAAPPAEDAGEEEAGDAEAEEEDEEDEALVALKESIALAEKVLSLTVKANQPSQPVDEDGEPIEAPVSSSPRRPMLGKPYGEIPEDQRNAPIEEKEESNPEEPRLREAALAAVVRWRITQKDCRCQGYVLDGYPKTVRDASLTFVVGEVPLPEPDDVDAPPGDSEEDAAALMSAVDDKVLPEFICFLQASEGLLLQRATSSPEGATSTAQDSADRLARFYRRYKSYRENFAEGAAPHKSLSSWFRAIMSNKEGAPRESTVSSLDASDGDLQAEMTKVSELLGAPHFYRPTPAEIVEEAKQSKLDEERRKLAQIQAEEEALRVAAEVEAAKQRETAKHERRYRSIQTEQEEAASMQNTPMQAYLMEYVVPTLTRGIANVVQLRPEDPVNALGDHLFNFTANRAL